MRANREAFEGIDKLFEASHMTQRISYFLGILLLVSALGICDSSLAQQAEEYALKASFVERFVMFVDWPEDPVSEASESLVVGVIGENPFDDYLDAAFDQPNESNRTVEIRQITDLDEVLSCDLLFISKSEKHSIRAILDSTAGKPILTIGDTEGFSEAGVIINFYVDGDRLHFKINISAVRESGLQLDSFLLDYAQIVDSSEVPDDES